MQSMCLLMIWLTLQGMCCRGVVSSLVFPAEELCRLCFSAAGMMVTPTTPATGAGDGLLIALAVVNVFLLVSPIVMGFVLGLQVQAYII
jgi:hypothetical protein